MDLSTSRDSQKLSCFAQFTIGLGKLSTCQKHSVGAIVCDPKFTEVLAIGYNGPPVGLPNDSCSGLDFCGCAHAEVNALVKPRRWSPPGEELCMICTKAPCVRCAITILNARCIKSFYHLELGKIKIDGINKLLEGGVKIWPLT